MRLTASSRELGALDGVSLVGPRAVDDPDQRKEPHGDQQGCLLSQGLIKRWADLLRDQAPRNLPR